MEWTVTQADLLNSGEVPGQVPEVPEELLNSHGTETSPPRPQSSLLSPHLVSHQASDDDVHGSEHATTRRQSHLSPYQSQVSERPSGSSRSSLGSVGFHSDLERFQDDRRVSETSGRTSVATFSGLPPPRRSLTEIISKVSEEINNDNAVRTTRSTQSLKKTPLKELSAQRAMSGWDLLKKDANPERGRIYNLIASPLFDPLIAIVVFLNASVMAVEMQVSGMNTGHRLGYPGEHQANWQHADQFFDTSEYIFGSLFCLELIIKILALREDWRKDPWNWMDMILVLAWVVSLVVGPVFPVDPTVLRAVRLLRFMRIVKLVRTIHGFESLYLMTASIKASMAALMWTIVILMLLQMSTALILNQSLLSFMLDDDEPEEARKEVFRYYGTFSKSTLTLFEMMLANWPDASRVLTESVSEFYIIFILGYQCMVGFAVVKVIMGVFLQVTLKIANTDDAIMVVQKEQALRIHEVKMKKLFHKVDSDKKGHITSRDFWKMLKDPTTKNWLASMDCDAGFFEGEHDTLFRMIDVSGEGKIKLEEFSKGIARLQGLARSFDLAMLADTNEQIRDVLQQVREDLKELASLHTSKGRVNSPCIPSESDYSDDSRANSKQPLRAKTRPLHMRNTNSVGSRVFRNSHRFTTLFENPEDWRTRLTSWVKSASFDLVFSLVIVVNCLVMAMQVQYMGFRVAHQLGYDRDGVAQPAHMVWPWAEDFFLVADRSFLFVFTVELLLKLAVLTAREFWGSFRNWLDLFLVSLGIAEVALPALLPWDSGLLRIARLTKLLRILRLFKSSKLFDSVYLMAVSIAGSLSALMWFSLIMMVIQMLIALLAAIGLKDFYDDESTPLAERHEVYTYFGTFSRAILTMFEVTLANWIPVCRVLTEYVSEWYMIPALTHKFMIGFAVITVMSGVFLQETFKAAASDDTILLLERRRQVKTHTEKMSLLFDAADEDGNGFLQRDEFLDVAQDRFLVVWLASMGLNVTDADALFTLVTKEGQHPNAEDGGITAEQLVKAVAHLKGTAKSIDLAVVRRANVQLLREFGDIQQELHTIAARV